MDVQSLRAFPSIEEVLADRLDGLHPASVQLRRAMGKTTLRRPGANPLSRQEFALQAGVAVNRVTFGHGSVPGPVR